MLENLFIDPTFQFVLFSAAKIAVVFGVVMTLLLPKISNVLGLT